MMRRVYLSGGLVVAVIVSPPGPVQAQEVSTMGYVAGGPETNGFSAAAGVRVDLFGTWGGYVRAALRGMTNVCESSLPPSCNYPEGETYEVALGVTYPISNGRWLWLLSAGGGVLSWQHELDPFLDLSLDGRRRLGDRVSLVAGLSGVFAPRVERERSGDDAIVRRRSVIFPNVVIGVGLRL